MKINKSNFFTKLSFQIYKYFVLLLLVFTFFLCSIFSNLYENNTKASYASVLLAQAEVIADRVLQYIESEDYEDYSVYMEVLAESTNYDVWISSNASAKQPLSMELNNVEFEEEDLDRETNKVLQKAYLGESSFATTYSSIHMLSLMIAGVPIWNDMECIGAVLILTPMEIQENATHSILILFIFSIVFSLLISFVLAILFAKKLSKPISKIGETACELIKGKYKARTNITRQDEIGQLAGIVDTLAIRLEEVEKERTQMEQVRKDFFANISHELKTPITVIRGYVESIVDGMVPDEIILQQYYGRILRECKGIQRLIEDLLLLSKMENPDFIIEAEPINLIQIFDDIMRSMRPVLEAKKIKINILKEKDYYFMLGDYDRIRQVFVAVIDNAIKFSDIGQNIHIKINDLDKIMVEVMDEGIGMKPEEVDHIFDKFYTQKKCNNKDGTGLGLVIAEKIVQKHNGTISVKSEWNKGSTFTFCFEKYDIGKEDRMD